MKKSSIDFIANKWLILLLIAFSLVACDSGNERNSAPEFIGMINVELKDVSLLNSGIFQLYIDGKFDSGSNSTCVVTHPLDSVDFNCPSVTYDENSTTLNIIMSIAGENASLALDFTDGTKVIATLTDGITTDVGGAVLVSPALVSRSVVTFDGDKYNQLSLLNPPIGYTSAYIADSNGINVATLWDDDISTERTDYATEIQSYLRSDTNDGIAQGSLTYVTQKGVPIEPLLPPETYGALLPPETYTVNFLPLPAAGSKEYKVTIAAVSGDATKPNDPITLCKDKISDPPVEPPEKELPPNTSEFNIEIAGVSTSLAGAETLVDPVLDVGEGPYKFSWRNTLKIPPTSYKWQVTFYSVDNAGVRIPHQQKRTNRILANGVGGPVYTAATPEITNDREWSWQLPADMTINDDEVVEVEFRASDFSNKLNGVAQSFFLTKLAPVLP